MTEHTSGSTLLPSPQDMLAWAEYYAFHMGWVIMPIHRWTGQYGSDGHKICSCELTGKRWNNCNPDKPGKHPWVGWKQTPMETPEQGYAAWRKVFDEYGAKNGVNIGVRTGPQSGIFAIDLDVSGDKDGVDKLQQWMQEEHLTWQGLATLSAQTGGGGTHLVYPYPPGVSKVVNVAGCDNLGGAGVDVRGDGGYILVAPSVHHKGNVYAWRDRGIDPSYLNPAPGQLIVAVTSTKKRTLVDVDDTYNPSLEELKDYADELQRKKTERSRNIGRNLAAVLNGDKIGEVGTRHDDYRDVVYVIKKRWPQCTSDGIMPYFSASLREWYHADDEYNAAVANVAATFAFTADSDVSWKSQLSVNDSGQPAATDANILLYLNNHQAWQNVFGYNERTNRPVYLKPPPTTDRIDTFNLSTDRSHISLWFQAKARMTGRIAQGDIQSAILAAARRNTFDPLQQDILRLRGTWDGVPRLETVFQRVAGTPDNAWARTISPLWFKSLLARILWPGCKCDTMLILEGAQGYRKSSFFQALIPDAAYFSDSLSRVKHDVETVRLIHSGPAVFEIGELSGLKKQEVEEIKTFLAAQRDDLRPLFEGYRTVPRRCVFVGTTNRDDYLRDETGGRRFWPLKVLHPIDLSIVFAERAQWFAEALHRVEAGERWFLDGEAENGLAVVEQDARFEEDIWFQSIADYLSAEKSKKPSEGGENTVNATKQMEEMLDRKLAGDFVTVKQVAENALNLKLEHAKNTEGTRINKILRRLGWIPDREYFGKVRVRGWRRPKDI